MDGALSGKTGFTGNAGYCYVGALQRDGKLLIVALLACGWPSHKGYKWVDTKKLMNYGLENFAKQEITPVGLQTDSVPVTDGQTESVATQVQLSEEGEQVQILMREDETIQTEIELAAELPAPVKKGDAVGTVRYVLDGTVYAEYSVVAAESVHQRDYRFILEEIVGNFLL
jgi:D-alanyl-D-alanine carboxypeptidase (penicillin-binding protein 5/6)